MMTGTVSVGVLALFVILACTPVASRAWRQAKTLELSCSRFPPTLDEASLKVRFGEQNITASQVTGSDDGPTNGTVVFPDSADTRLEVAWLDPVSKRYPLWIRVRGEHSEWRTANGVTLGADLQSLERANGRAFRLAGFQTERQGAVLSWAGGRLQLQVAHGCTVTIRLQPQYDGTEDLELVRQVRGGREYSSGHPAMQELNPRVVELAVTYGSR